MSKLKKDKKQDIFSMEVPPKTGAVMTAILAVLALVFIFPILLVLMNSFKNKLYVIFYQKNKIKILKFMKFLNKL